MCLEVLEVPNGEKKAQSWGMIGLIFPGANTGKRVSQKLVDDVVALD